MASIYMALYALSVTTSTIPVRRATCWLRTLWTFRAHWDAAHREDMQLLQLAAEPGRRFEPIQR